MPNEANPTPPVLQQKIDHWLRVNEKTPEQVLYGSFPLGMVQRWIERAEAAEGRIQEIKGDLDGLADLLADSEDLRVKDTPAVARLNKILHPEARE